MAPTVISVALSTGVTLPYVVHGDATGVPVLLLHGPTDSWRSFEPLIAHLPPSVRAFAPSQRGHGDADRPAGGYRPADFAADAAAFIDAVGLETALLVGHSPTPPSASPSTIPSGPSASCSSEPRTPSTTSRGAQALQRAVAELTDPVDPEFVREFVASTVTERVPAAFLETCIAECCKVPARAWEATFQGLFESPAPTESGTITAPTLLLWGDQDRLCPRSDQDALVAAIAEAEVVIYHGAGHSPHFEQPERAAADLAAFALRIKPTATIEPGW